MSTDLDGSGGGGGGGMLYSFKQSPQQQGEICVQMMHLTVLPSQAGRGKGVGGTMILELPLPLNSHTT